MSEEAALIEQLSQFFKNLGADEKQSVTLSEQTLKRSKQMAETSQISQEEALERLLKAVLKGRQGEPYSVEE